MRRGAARNVAAVKEPRKPSEAVVRPAIWGHGDRHASTPEATHMLRCDALLETAQTPACAASSRDGKTLGYQGSGRAQRLRPNIRERSTSAPPSDA